VWWVVVCLLCYNDGLEIYFRPSNVVLRISATTTSIDRNVQSLAM